MSLDLEQIKPWDGISDTGKEARLKLNRNFAKIEESIEEEETTRSNADATLQARIEEEETARAYADVLKLDYIKLEGIVSADIDSLIAPGKYRIAMSESDTTFSTSAFTLDVDVDGSDDYAITQRRKVLNKTYSRTSITSGETWGEWVLVSDDFGSLINTEETARSYADATLQENINSEANLRKTVDALRLPNLVLDGVEDIDSFIERGHYSINMGGGGTYVPSEFVLDVEVDGDNVTVTQKRHVGVKTYGRTSIDEGATWEDWVLIGDDLAKKADKFSLIGVTESDIDDLITSGEYTILMATDNYVNGVSEFVLKISVDGGGTIIQEQHYDVETQTRVGYGSPITWQDWKLTGVDQKAVVVIIDFTVIEAFEYNVPYAVKFTSMTYQNEEPTLSVDLNTELAEYDTLTITPASTGMVKLYFTKL